MSSERSDESHEAAAERLYQFIAHGDKDHRAWLRAASLAFFTGQPRPIEVRTVMVPFEEFRYFA
jgi:hypothetical protein